MTIFVTWQLRVTLDTIRNSCNVSYQDLTSKTKYFFQYHMVYAEPETLREMEAKSKEYLESRNNFVYTYFCQGVLEHKIERFPKRKRTEGRVDWKTTCYFKKCQFTRVMIVTIENRKWWLEKTYSSFGSIIGKGDILLQTRNILLCHTEGWLLEDMQLYSAFFTTFT